MSLFIKPKSTFCKKSQKILSKINLQISCHTSHVYLHFQNRWITSSVLESQKAQFRSRSTYLNLIKKELTR